MLESILAHAAKRFDAELRRALPASAPRLTAALERVPLAEDGSMAASALGPRAFPTYALPLWITPADRRETDREFHHDVAFSTLNGYYFIRMVDNVCDNDAPPELVKLLPCAAYFLAAFQSPYQRYFPPDHPFWTRFHAAWAQQAEASASDALLDTITYEDFERVAALKFSAAKIPLAAAAYRYDRPELIEPWSHFIDQLGGFYQMINDFFDSRRDLELGVNTFFLSEWRGRRVEEEDLEAWYAREGYDLGRRVLRAMSEQVIETTATLSVTEPVSWIARRLEELDLQNAKLGLSLEAFRRISGIVGRLAVRRDRQPNRHAQE